MAASPSSEAQPASQANTDNTLTLPTHLTPPFFRIVVQADIENKCWTYECENVQELVANGCFNTDQLQGNEKERNDQKLARHKSKEAFWESLFGSHGKDVNVNFFYNICKIEGLKKGVEDLHIPDEEPTQLPDDLIDFVRDFRFIAFPSSEMLILQQPVATQAFRLYAYTWAELYPHGNPRKDLNPGERDPDAKPDEPRYLMIDIRHTSKGSETLTDKFPVIHDLDKVDSFAGLGEAEQEVLKKWRSDPDVVNGAHPQILFFDKEDGWPRHE